LSQEIPRTYRWRRRQVPYTRVTWVGMVAVLLILIHDQLTRVYPMGMTLKAALFIAIVVIPTILVILWRQGLLPPERVPVDEPPAER
jgi:hypothetical protein